MSIENETIKSDRDRLALQFLNEASERFNLDQVAECDELYRVIDDIQSFVKNGISSDIGFETAGDSDLTNLKEWIMLAFGEELLAKAAISRITLQPDIVHLNLGKGLYLTEEEYENWLGKSPRIAEFKVRAENFTTFQTTGWLKKNFDIESAPLPVILYSFINEPVDSLQHLQDAPAEKRLELFKRGTVAHEIGHHLFSLLLKQEQRDEFADLCKSEATLTEYSLIYKGKKIYEEEQFCEAVRLATTNPSFLKLKSITIFNWLHKHFPQINMT